MRSRHSDKEGEGTKVQQRVEDVMKIGDIYSPPPQIATHGSSAADSQSSSALRNRAAATESKPALDRSELSSVASLASRSSDLQSTERAERVARLKAEFEAGRYEPDTAKISKALVQSALDSTASGR